MRILMTNWLYAPEFSGAALQCHRLSLQLAKLGAKVAHLLSPAVLKKCFAALLTTVGLYFIYQGFMA